MFNYFIISFILFILLSGLYNLFFWARVDQLSDHFGLKFNKGIVAVLQTGTIIVTLLAFIFASFILL